MEYLDQCGIDGIQVFKSGPKSAAGFRFLEDVASGEIFSQNEFSQDLAQDILNEVGDGNDDATNARAQRDLENAVEEIARVQVTRDQAEATVQQRRAEQGENFDETGFWLGDAFEASRFEDLGVPAEALQSEAAARQFYRDMARRYHPDRGGTTQQMQNLNRLQEQMLGVIAIMQ